ncbi:cyclic peptide export ABC transporter [Pseudoalteromonas sp. S16_S37]|uniref:cyclic peptide export ABC transporter n=1 Tax=Pseudoalteromonas sp. S16_S37 TaxID=2720228 RepID=UPI0016816954|nr:cyclic peptide export ABC transporter [Pseudoalteromonas sp. S16_S37]MBD1581639.1 cyclic peptide export ABC transporter [Pseudoalteromonas sp. S16_S37]
MSITKQLLKDAKSNIIFAMLASMLSASAGIAIIAGINYVIEQGVSNLSTTAGLYIALLAVLLASSVWSQVLLVNIGYNMVFKLRKNLVNRILNTSIERQEQLGSTDIYNVLTRDVTMVSNATRQLPVAMYNSFLVLAGLLYLLWLSPVLFLFVCVVVAIGVWTDAKLTDKLQYMLTKVRRLDDTLFQHYEAVVEGRNELALNQKRRQVLFDEQFMPTSEESRAQASKAEVIWAVNLNWTTLLIFFVIGVVFFAGLKLESVGQDVVVAYILAIMFLRTPLSMILDSIPSVIKGNVALQAINRLDLNEDDSSVDTIQSAPVDFKSLQLKQVQYQYPTHNGEQGFTLGPIDFEVHKGELIFLIGGNGSGKSTLAKLLTGLYQESSGQLLLNGTQINDNNRSQLRNCFSAIFPNFYLFSDVVDTHGSSQDDEKISHYLERLAINNKVSVQQGQLSTTALSQGQRKRLALVLLYMENRQVLLLDEWAADQDPVFREVFYREILPQLQRDGKTVIAISHDDHYFDVADRIYKLDYGQLTQFDTHKHQLFSAS